MRILVLMPPSVYTKTENPNNWEDLFKGAGGAERVAIEHVTYLKQNHEVSIMIFGKKTEIFGIDNVKIYSFENKTHFPFLQNVFHKREICDILKTINPKIVHVHTPTIISSHISDKGYSTVVSFHNSENEFIKPSKILSYLRFLYRQYILFKTIKNSKKLTTTSKRMVSFYKKYTGKNIQLVRNGIDELKFYKIKKIKRHPKSILYVGKKEKGLEHIVRLSLLMNDYSFMIAGPIKQSDIKNINGGYISNNLELHGVLNSDELNKLYNASTYCVFPSKFDNFPLVGLEAMSTSSIVISGYKGFSEYIDGKNGIAIPNINAGKIYKVIKFLEEKNDLREKIIERGLKTSKEYYNRNVFEGYTKIYKSIIQ